MDKNDFLDISSWFVSAVAATLSGFKAVGYDPLRALFGRNLFVERAFYAIAGLAGLVSLYQLVAFYRMPAPVRDMMTTITRRAA